MANRYIPELPEALEVQEADLLPMYQGNVTKKVSGLTMKLWLLKLAESHGGITDFRKISESGLEKTYQFTLTDTTKYTFTVTDGNGIESFQHSVSGLVHTYTFVLDDATKYQFQVKDGNGIADFKNSVSGLVRTCTFIMDDGTQYQFQVTDGEKGDKGDNAYVWFKFASEKPTSSGSSMGDEVDDWIGFYSGSKATAPTDPMEYVWAPFKGAKGSTGDPATLTSAKIEYQAGTSGTIVPSGSWSANVPVTTQGQYLWTRITLQFNTGNPITFYTNGYNGVNGTGAVTAVNGINPGPDGVVWLTAADVGALPIDGGTMLGPINMAGQAITGLNDPTEGTDAARKDYVDKVAQQAFPENVLDNSDFTHFIAQAGLGGSHGNDAYAGDRWVLRNGSISGTKRSNGLGYTDIQISHTTGEYCDLVQLTPDYDQIAGEAYTVALENADGQRYCGNFQVGAQAGPITLGDVKFYSTPTQHFIFRVSDQKTVSIRWLMVIPGTYSLDTLPRYRGKGYAVELQICRTYYENSWNGTTKNAACQTSAFIWSASAADGVIPYKASKRIIPTVIFYPDASNAAWQIYLAGVGYVDVGGVSTFNRTGLDSLGFRLAKASGDGSTWNMGETVTVRGHWEACADL